MAHLLLVQREVAEAMDRILSHFKDGAKITVVVRSPGYPDRDFMMTNDDTAELVKLIERRAIQQENSMIEKTETPGDVQDLVNAARAMKRVVEGTDGAMNHGAWRDEKGLRLKDTPEWVALYNAITAYDRLRPHPPHPRRKP